MGEERWIDAAEAFDFGFIDEIFEPKKMAAGVLDKKAVAEKINAEHKLPPLPENYFININEDNMDLHEKLNTLIAGMSEMIKGKEKEGFKVIRQRRLQSLCGYYGG